MTTTDNSTLAAIASNDQDRTYAADLAAQVVIHRNVLLNNDFPANQAHEMARLFHAHLLNREFANKAGYAYFPPMPAQEK